MQTCFNRWTGVQRLLTYNQIKLWPYPRRSATKWSCRLKSASWERNTHKSPRRQHQSPSRLTKQQLKSVIKRLSQWTQWQSMGKQVCEGHDTPRNARSASSIVDTAELSQITQRRPLLIPTHADLRIEWTWFKFKTSTRTMFKERTRRLSRILKCYRLYLRRIRSKSSSTVVNLVTRQSRTSLMKQIKWTSMSSTGQKSKMSSKTRRQIEMQLFKIHKLSSPSSKLSRV